MSKIISFFNQAGGMGKTTLTANVGYHLGVLEKKVLLVDMDPQASLTYCCGLEPRKLNATIENALIDKVDPYIAKEWYGTDLIPANSNLAAVDSDLKQMDNWHFKLKEILSALREQYDYILIDCPPSLGPLSLMSLIASTHLIIPVKTNAKGLEGTEDLRETITGVISKANRRLRVIGAIPTMFDGRTNHDRKSLARIRKEFGKLPVFPPIPEATDLDNAWDARQPIAVFSKNHIVVQFFSDIANFLVRNE